MYNYMHANGLANTQSLCMCVRMHVYHNHTHTNSPTHPSARTYSHIMYTNMTEYYAHRTNAQEDAVQGMTAWFEGVGLVPPDAKAVAVACFQQQIFDVISLCMMPEKSLCEALDVLPIGLRPFVPMIIKAARGSKATRELATLTPSSAMASEWMRNVGFSNASAAIVRSVLEANHMRSKGLVLAQEPAELELVAGKLPAPAKHAFLAVVHEARSQQQFTLGPPPRLITGKWADPLKTCLNELGIFDDTTIQEIEAVFSGDNLKIRCVWSLFAMEDSELSSALTASKLPPIVQKTLIKSIKIEVLSNSVQIANAIRKELTWYLSLHCTERGGEPGTAAVGGSLPRIVQVRHKPCLQGGAVYTSAILC